MPNHKTLLLASLLLIPLGLFAQNDAQLANDLRTNPIPYYNFKKGLSITSPDSAYQVNLRFRMQNRVSSGESNNGDAFVDGQIRRLRLRFDGYVGHPNISYTLQLGFAPGDLSGPARNGENIQIIRDAVVFYKPSRHWIFGFGQTKLPGNRQRLNSSGALQLSDRSINNANFTIDRDFGAQIHWVNQHDDRFSYNIKTSVSMGEGRVYTDNNDANLAYTGKLELYPFGSFTKGGEYFEGDLMREPKPRLMLSGAYSFNNKAKQTMGQIGQALYAKRDLHGIFGDLIFKYRGFALMSAYMQRKAWNPVTRNPASPAEIRYVYAGHGMDYQVSYLFKSNIEVIGRYSWQHVDATIHTYAPHLQQASIGLTKYVREHTLKLQCEATYNMEDYAIGPQQQNWYARFQLELGI